MTDAAETQTTTTPRPATPTPRPEGTADPQTADPTRAAAVAAYLTRRPGNQPSGTNQRGEHGCSPSSGTSGHPLRVLDLIRHAEHATGTSGSERVDAAMPPPSRDALTALARSSQDMHGPSLQHLFLEVTGRELADHADAFDDLRVALAWVEDLNCGAADPLQLLGADYTGRHPVEDAVAQAGRMTDDALARLGCAP